MCEAIEQTTEGRTFLENEKNGLLRTHFLGSHFTAGGNSILVDTPAAVGMGEGGEVNSKLVKGYPLRSEARVR